MKKNAMQHINGTGLDDRVIRTEWDAGFKEGWHVGDLEARLKMSMSRTMILGEAAVENWHKTSKW
jgi:hypothetical protein